MKRLPPKSAPELLFPEEPDDLGELSHDAIAGSYRIWQRRAGHRYSLDDVLTAWEAAHAIPHARQCLELGTGIGSVLLMLAHALPDARFHAVEAQRNSFALLSRNVADNGLSARVQLHHADLRTWCPPIDVAFDLITGTPPYVLPGTATPAADSQKSFCRQEWRGGVEGYLAAAKPVLSPHGKIVICADARTPNRVFRAAEALGLSVLTQRDVVPRAAQKASLFSVFVLCHKRAATPNREHLLWYARDTQGKRTADYHAVRSFFGMAESA
jgi:tRNA1(Val) A37 N6-methylase TrmN6